MPPARARIGQAPQGPVELQQPLRPEAPRKTFAGQAQAFANVANAHPRE